MESDFQDKFSYLAAFLAVIVGPAAFKDVASSHYLLIFGVRLNCLVLSLPLVISTLLATYLGALTLIVKRWNFILFPLGKILETSSYGMAATGLLYPLLIPIACLLSYTVRHLHSINHANGILATLTIIQGIFTSYIAARYAFSKERAMEFRFINTTARKIN